jgi:t-SNARE complex subunit (syntaxin)
MLSFMSLFWYASGVEAISQAILHKISSFTPQFLSFVGIFLKSDTKYHRGDRKMQTNGLQMNHPTEGLRNMGSTDHSKRGSCNLKLLEDDSQTVQTIRLPGRLEASVKPAEKLQKRVDELEQEVELLQQQLKTERRLAQIDPLTGIANRRAFAAYLKIRDRA